jgi:hypothetical protein
MINVAICTPSYGGTKTRYTMSLVRMLINYTRTPIFGLENETEREYSYNVIQGSMVCTAREDMVAGTLKMNATHLLFIDEDMGFEGMVLNQLLSRQLPFVACNYPMKTWPQTFTARSKDCKSWVTTDENSKSCEEVDFCGLGMALIERQVLEALGPAPNFLNTWVDEYKGYSTEDRYFCHKVREKGFPVYIDHDASKLVYHIGDHSYCWQDGAHSTLPKFPYPERLRRK